MSDTAQCAGQETAEGAEARDRAVLDELTALPGSRFRFQERRIVDALDRPGPVSP